MKILQRNKHYIKILEIAFILFIFLVMLNRIQYGINFTDESWYVAEPYAVAELGAVPFVNNVTQSPGFTLPLALAFKLYVWLNGSTVGIVYFSRVLYLCVHLFVSALTVWLVNRYTSFKVPLLAIGALIVIDHCDTLYDLDYNTLGFLYFPLIMVLVFAEYGDDTRRSFWWGFFAGLLSVRTVMGSPTVIFGLVVVFLYLCVSKKKKRILGVVLGAGTACLIIFGVVLAGWGIERLCDWFQMYFNQSYFFIESKANEPRTRNALISFFKSALLPICIVAMSRIFLKKHPHVFDWVLRFVIVGGVIFGVARTVRSHAYYYEFQLMAMTWVLPYLYCCFANSKRSGRMNILIICLAYLSIFFIATWVTISGFPGHRAYWNYVPMLMAVCLLVNGDSREKLETGKFLRAVLFVAGIGAISFYGVWSNYSYVYKDEPIPSLSAKVEDGIWKGLYTTEVRANNVVTLEQYIKSVTNENECILYLDYVSFGYLMGNGRMCSPTTLDIAVYAYGVNRPHPYYLYFKAEHNVPDKIIYIDYGHDKHLSIDDDEWKFNKLVWHHYHFASAYRNEVFAAKVYVLDDREGALRLVEETLRNK